MSTRRLWGLLLAVACWVQLFAGCATLYPAVFPPREELDRKLKDYQQLFRWRDFGTAAIMVNEPLRSDYLKQSVELRKLEIVDTRIIHFELKNGDREAEAEMEIDYYRLPSVTVRTVVDHQTWARFPGGYKDEWYLTSPLPEFK